MGQTGAKEKGSRRIPDRIIVAATQPAWPKGVLSKMWSDLAPVAERARFDSI